MAYKKIFTLSFDDGTEQDKRLVELINKYNLKCTFNLNSGLFGTIHNLTQEGITFSHNELPAEEIKDLYKGHEIAVHTLTHPGLSGVSDEEIIRQVDEDRENLEKLTEQKIIGMAYPGGPYYDERVISVILNNTPIRYARTAYVKRATDFSFPERFMEWHPTCNPHEEDVFELLQKFIDAKEDRDMLFYLWGHSFEFDKYNEWDRIEEIFKLISNRDDILYMTNGEIYQYINNN